MNVAIFYRSATVWNIILFALLTFLFLFFQEGLFQARSVFDQAFLKEVAVQYLPFNILLALCIVGVFRLRVSSKHLFVACALITVAFTVDNLIGTFSKLVVIALFLYTLTAYYFYQFLRIELEEAYYNPQYQEDDLFDPMLKKLSCEVVDVGTGHSFTARLTNWNPNGCFIYLEEREDLAERVKEAKFKNVVIKTTMGDRPFEALGALAAKFSDGRGFGFRLKNDKEDEFGWKDYYSIIDQMGYQVELLK